MTLPPYSGNYDPIHNEKIYCGKKDNLPHLRVMLDLEVIGKEGTSYLNFNGITH
jgi:hypothetical protein